MQLASSLSGDVALPRSDVRILVCADNAGAERSTTWGEFVADNADGLDGFELGLIATAIAAGRSYRGGGGATGAWTVRPPRAAINPRYAAYMSAHLVGDPALMIAIDSQRYPGGHMCGFLLWNAERARQWIALCGHGSARNPDLYLYMHGDDYDAWLLSHFPPFVLER